jgi:hypothetical protein
VTTGDPLFWGLILIIGLIVGALVGLLDRQRQERIFLYVATSVFGAALGAHFIGPVLQIALNPPAGEFHWPGPASMEATYLIVGTAAGAILANVIVPYVSKER